MVSKFAPKLAEICKATTKTFQKSGGTKTIEQCAKELGIEVERVQNYCWPSMTVRPAQYASMQCAKTLGLDQSSIILKTLNNTLGIEKALQAYPSV